MKASEQFYNVVIWKMGREVYDLRESILGCESKTVRELIAEILKRRLAGEPCGLTVYNEQGGTYTPNRILAVGVTDRTVVIPTEEVRKLFLEGVLV
jgi:hypothetical protein